MLDGGLCHTGLPHVMCALVVWLALYPADIPLCAPGGATYHSSGGTITTCGLFEHAQEVAGSLQLSLQVHFFRTLSHSLSLHDALLFALHDVVDVSQCGHCALKGGVMLGSRVHRRRPSTDVST